jgi:putative acetyltransferase
MERLFLHLRAMSNMSRLLLNPSLMCHILKVAKQRSYRRLSLETDSMEAFAPARSLYARFGFQAWGPFADYVEDPYSVFMTREL